MSEFGQAKNGRRQGCWQIAERNKTTPQQRHNLVGRKRGEAENSDRDQAVHRGFPIGSLKITSVNVRIWTGHAIYAHFEKVVQQLECERDARVAELQGTHAIITQLLEFESAFMGNVVPLENPQAEIRQDKGGKRLTA